MQPIAIFRFTKSKRDLALDFRKQVAAMFNTIELDDLLLISFECKWKFKGLANFSARRRCRVDVSMLQ
jgi:hypothetical protein